jgi:hypothetical protein
MQMTGPLRLCQVAALMFFACAYSSAQAQQDRCGSPAFLEKIKNIFVSKAAANIQWWNSLNINTPPYRMKDVRFELVSSQQIGTTYAGIDCRATMRLYSPPDVSNQNAVQVNVKFVIQQDGNIDLY